jgi:serine protease Do
MHPIRKFFVVTLVIGAVLVSCGSGTNEEAAQSGPAESEGPETEAESGQTTEQQESTQQAGADASRSDSTTESARQQALGFQQVFRDVAAEVLPVVVEVNVVDVVEVQQPQSPFEFFFGPDQEGEGDERQFRRQGLGSGVIVRRNGNTAYVITNAHVVSEVDEVSVVLSDEREFDAEIVGTDRRLDLALLSFEAEGDIPVAEFGNSNELEVGNWVVAVGNPLGFQSTVTTGIVSALGRSAPRQGQAVSNVTNFIQTDAAINPGNSGGALANLDGEIIGINTWIASRSGGSVGLGFAIPANNAQKAVEDFIEHGQVVYGWLGVSIGDANPQAYPNVREDLELGEASGALVFNVYTGSPADEEGILPGDYITAVNGNSIENSGELTRFVGGLRPGETVEFELIRYGEPRTVTVDITQRRPEEEIQQQTGRVWPGMYVINLTDQLSERLNLGGEDGVVVRAAVEGSPAAQSGLRQGDLITVVNGQSIDSMQSFYRALNEDGGPSDQVRIIRQGRTIERRLTQ